MPQIVGFQAVGVNGVASSVLATEWVGGVFQTLVERQEPRLGALQCGAHHYFLVVNGKVYGTTLRREQQLLGVAVVLILKNCLCSVLLGEVVFQLHCDNRQTVDEHSNVDRLLRGLAGEMELTNNGKAVGLI